MKLLLISLIVCLAIVNCEQVTGWAKVKKYVYNFLKVQKQYLSNSLEKESILAYDSNGAVNWANSCCGGTGCSECTCICGGGQWCDDTGCACAEFVSRALIYGGAGIPVIKSVGSLRDALEGQGWQSVGDVQAGDAVFYNEPGDDFGHVCIGVGDGVVDCHNNNRCSATATNEGTIALILRA